MQQRCLGAWMSERGRACCVQGLAIAAGCRAGKGPPQGKTSSSLPRLLEKQNPVGSETNQVKGLNLPGVGSSLVLNTGQG